MNELFAYGFGIPASLFLINLGIFWTLIRLKGPFGRPFSEIRNAWLNFIKQGIPIPADYKRLDYGLRGEAVFTPAVFETRRNDPIAK